MLCTQQPRQFERWAPVGQKMIVQDYYISRECRQDDRDYWEPKCDPDGRSRDRLSVEEFAQWKCDNLDLIRWFDAHEPGNVCDFGCGPGWLLQEIKALGDKWHVIGVETSERALLNLRAHGILSTRTLDDVDPGCSHYVVCNHVIEHHPHPIELLESLRYTMRFDGWLILGTPDFHSPCAVRFGRNYRMLHDQTHCSLFTLESMSRCLRDLGFIIEDIQFPFPERYATAENFARWNDTSKVSPAWPGNWMTFYCRRSNGGTNGS